MASANAARAALLIVTVVDGCAVVVVDVEGVVALLSVPLEEGVALADCVPVFAGAVLES
ncbi:hypothetical protein [Paraburkholderia acidisoli]|uniref:Uncharacterized protein n=1 Tax=Paraburkholderia acidisoli TaxID=2571748 RepID=A0A7Z2GPM8_9BURK|nr:hypothetical protein [Paraburkholderia acidisoli]QGZ65653.1 hypothetical protein FAZ98_28350 [Paraburkholderia acidisoli]